MKNINEKMGITLIALIITIIILIILAAISTSLVLSDSGILKRSEESVIKTAHADVTEKVILVGNEYRLEKTVDEIDIGLIEYLQEQSIIGEELKDNDGKGLGIWVIDVQKLNSKSTTGKGVYPNDVYVLEESKTARSVNEMSYTIKYYGNETQELGILKDSKNEEDVIQYGDYVHYSKDLNSNGNDGDDWRIFYDNDDGNIFLISDNYVKSTSPYLTLDKAGMRRPSTNANYIYSVNWGTIKAETGNEYVNSDIAELFMYETHYKAYPTSKLTNVKAVSTLLDTDAWAGLVDESVAMYATGGPTIEMWMASWNSKGYTPLNHNKINSTGYFISTDTASENQYMTMTDKEGFSDTLYNPPVINSYTNNYWLAGSGASENSRVFTLDHAGFYAAVMTYNNNYVGIRPVVCLKNDVKLTKDGNGIWMISVE